MEKLVYIGWKSGAPPMGTLRARLLEEAGPRIIGHGVRGLVMQVGDLSDEPAIPPERFFGQGRDFAFAASLWLDSYDTRAAVEEALRAVCPEVAGYLVTESVPQACEDRDWADGEKSPGVTQFTVFPQPGRLSDDEFFRGWHEKHTPFSFDLHPLRWSYTRNVVARLLTSGALPLRAIVEERFRSVQDFADPERYYGSMEVAKQSGEEAVEYVDMETLHSTAMTEYILRSGGPGPV